MVEIKDTANDLEEQPAAAVASAEESEAEVGGVPAQVVVGESVRRSTFIPAPEGEVSNLVYVQDRPFRRLLKQVALTGAAAVLILATIGFIMGLNGLRTPHISEDAISNEWHSIIGNDSGDQNWDELEKNP